MNLAAKLLSIALSGLLLASMPRLAAQSHPNINKKFPIDSGNELSPPQVSPVSGCAKAVFVHGYLLSAIVRVYANSGAYEPKR